MQLILIRHGQSFNNALNDATARVADPELTERGVEQARLVADHLAAGGHLRASERHRGPMLDELYCSAMIRALQTTQPIAGALGLTPRVLTDVHEIGGIYLDNGDGTATGFPDAPGRRSQPGLPVSSATASGTAAGGVGAGRLRARGVAEPLPPPRGSWRAPGSRCGSGSCPTATSLSALIKALADHLPSWGLQYHHENTAITRIDFDRRVVVAYMNRADHLPTHLLSE